MKAPAASVYKKVIDAMEREHQEEEKMYSAIRQGAGRKAIEAVRAESSMQMKTILAELNMEQFRRVPLYEAIWLMKSRKNNIRLKCWIMKKPIER